MTILNRNTLKKDISEKKAILKKQFPKKYNSGNRTTKGQFWTGKYEKGQF